MHAAPRCMLLLAGERLAASLTRAVDDRVAG
eukprot:COSAG06_NODE_43739_length_369_cov_0.937037_1_plen_30_part_01